MRGPRVESGARRGGGVGSWASVYLNVSGSRLLSPLAALFRSSIHQPCLHRATRCHRSTGRQTMPMMVRRRIGIGPTSRRWLTPFRISRDLRNHMPQWYAALHCLPIPIASHSHRKSQRARGDELASEPRVSNTERTLPHTNGPLFECSTNPPPCRTNALSAFAASVLARQLRPPIAIAPRSLLFHVRLFGCRRRSCA